MNLYPVSYEDFLKMKAVGNQIIAYCILPDRIHFEMRISGQSMTFCTQKFLFDILERIEKKAENYEGDAIQEFLKETLTDITAYRFYPLQEHADMLSRIKLYTRLVVASNEGISSLDPTTAKVEETDRDIRIFSDSKMLMTAVKEKR